MKMTSVTTIDEFLRELPAGIRKKLEQIRKAARKIAPEAEEAIRYGMPTFRLGRNMLHFNAYEGHIGFYPGPGGIDAFAKACAPYRTGKGTLQFSPEGKLPMKLIEDIIRFRVKQERERLEAKGPRKAASPWSVLPAPAQRALAKEKIKTVKQLAKWSKAELLSLHGMGPGSIPKLVKILQEHGLQLKH